MRMRISTNIVIVNLISLINALINYLTIMILARYFGAGREIDAYFAAITIPQIFTAVLGIAVTNTFVPIFTRERLKDERNAWAFANSMINLSVVFFTGLAILISYFAFDIISFFNPGFNSSCVYLAASMFRYLIFSLIFSELSIILCSIQYSFHRFLKPIISQTLNNLTVFLGVLILKDEFGIKSVAVAILSGSFLQFLFLFIFTKSRYNIKDGLANKYLKEFILLSFPVFVSTIFYKSNFLVERFFASLVGEGAISYLGYGSKIINFLLIFVTQGFTVVLFPKMSEHTALDDIEKLKDLVSKALRVLILIGIPLVFFMYVGRHDLVKFLFERGKFSPTDTKIVGNAVGAYLGFFLAGILSPPVVNALYSLKQTLVISIVGFAGYIFYILLSLFLLQYFSYMGIAVALSIQYLISWIILFLILIKEIGDFGKSEVIYCGVKSILASVCSICLIEFFKMRLFPIENTFLNLLFLLLVGMPSYLLFLYLLRTKELRLLTLEVIPFIKFLFLPLQKLNKFWYIKK